jgi:hypothetical protein
MKHNKSFLTSMLLLLGVSALVTLSGCKPANEDPKPQGDPNIVEFNDFEEFEPDFQLLRLENNFGKVSVNTQTDYVKSGLQSAKLQALGSYSKNTKPLIYFELFSERFEYAYNDINYLYSMTFHIYNASVETKEIEVGVATSIISLQHGITQDGGMPYYLKPGWNKVTYFLEPIDLYIPDGSTLVEGLYLQFENKKSLDLADADVYYLDDVTLKMKPEFKEIVIADHSIGMPVEGEEVFVPNATIEGGQVSYVVYHNDLEVPVTNGHFTVSEGGDYEIIYQANVDGFIYKKRLSFFARPNQTLDIIDFNSNKCLDQLAIRGPIDRIEWLDAFDNEFGVAKFVISRDWPSFFFTPTVTDKNAYDNFDYIVVRIYCESGANQVRWMSLNDAAVSTDYAGHYPLDQWTILKFPIASFVNNITSSYFVLNSTDYINFGNFYISDMFAM